MILWKQNCSMKKIIKLSVLLFIMSDVNATIKQQDVSDVFVGIGNDNVVNLDVSIKDNVLFDRGRFELLMKELIVPITLSAFVGAIVGSGLIDDSSAFSGFCLGGGLGGMMGFVFSIMAGMEESQRKKISFILAGAIAGGLVKSNSFFLSCIGGVIGGALVLGQACIYNKNLDE